MSTPPSQAAPGYGYPSVPGPPPLGAGQPPLALGAERPEPRGRWLLRRARWGFGGAVLASVVWTVAVWTVPSMVRPPSAAPPAGRYRVADNLCATAGLRRFGELYPVQSGAPYHYTTRNKALDDMYCSEYLKKAGTDSGYVTLYLEVQLHHAVNPAPEFEAQRAGFAQRRFQLSDVPQLGGEAFTAYLDDQSGADRGRHYLTQTLYVRDGAMTCYLNWSGSYLEGKETAPDRETIREALLIDTRDALRALGGRG